MRQKGRDIFRLNCIAYLRIKQERYGDITEPQFLLHFADSGNPIILTRLQVPANARIPTPRLNQLISGSLLQQYLPRLIENQDMSSTVDQQWITVAATARSRTYDPVMIINDLEKFIVTNRASHGRRMDSCRKR